MNTESDERCAKCVASGWCRLHHLFTCAWKLRPCKRSKNRLFYSYNFKKYHVMPRNSTVYRKAAKIQKDAILICQSYSVLKNYRSKKYNSREVIICFHSSLCQWKMWVINFFQFIKCSKCSPCSLTTKLGRFSMFM